MSCGPRFGEAMKITSVDRPAQVVQAREMGTIERAVWGAKSKQGSKIAMTAGGAMWTDLPFLAAKVRVALGWFLEMEAVQRVNLSAFTARLLASGICVEELSVCALWALKDVFETPRQVTAEDQGGSTERIPLVELLPAAVPWFEYSGHKVQSLSMKSHTFGDLSLTISAALGGLAHSAGVVPEAGFSVPRWLFWKDRFEELSRCSDEKTAEVALRGFKKMKFWGENIVSTTQKAASTGK